MFKKIPANLNFDLFRNEDLFSDLFQMLMLNCYKTMEKTITVQFF